MINLLRCLAIFSLLTTSVLAQQAELRTCLISSLPSIDSNALARNQLIGALRCMEDEKLRLLQGAAYGKIGNSTGICSSSIQLDTECKDWFVNTMSGEGLNAYLVEQIMSCLPPQHEASLLLGEADIQEPAQLIQGLSQFYEKLSSCDEELEYQAMKGPPIWESTCNDYKEQAISFYHLNDNYYEPCTPQDPEQLECSPGEEAQRKTDLLRQYSLSSSAPESWQRIISSIIGIESLNLSEFPQERAAAAKMLGKHGDFSPSVKFSLLNALEDSDPFVRSEAALALRTQGNRKPLVVFSLLKILMNPAESPSGRGNAALALREQAINFGCQPEEEALYDLVGDENPLSNVNGVPLCIPFSQQDHDQASAEEGGEIAKYAGLGPALQESCALDSRAVSNTFDQFTSPDQLSGFDIAKNLCFVDIEARPSKIIRLAREAVLMALSRETDSDAMVKMVASLRTLGKAEFEDRGAIERIRSSYLRHSNYRIRQASLYSLGSIAKTESWFLDQELPYFLRLDPSPSVRKAAVAAASEAIPFSRGSASQSIFKHYVHGVELARSYPPECYNSPELNNIIELTEKSLRSTPGAFNMFIGGYGSVQDFIGDIRCSPDDLVEGDPTTKGRPILLLSQPDFGEVNVPLSSEIALYFEDMVDRQSFKDKVQIIYRGSQVSYDITHFESFYQDSRPHTHIKLKTRNSLKPNTFYQVKFLEGFKVSFTQGPGYEYERSFLFQTESTGLGDRIFDQLSQEPNLEVKFAIAEGFLINDQEIVREFLFNMLASESPVAKDLASRYLSSGFLSYTFLSSWSLQEKTDFVEFLFENAISFINEHEKHLSTDSIAYENYEFLPSIHSYYRLLEFLSKEPWMSQALKDYVKDRYQMKTWLLGRFKNDFQPNIFSQYDRMNYGPIRNTIKSIFNHLIANRDTGPESADYQIYKDIPLQRETAN